MDYKSLRRMSDDDVYHTFESMGYDLCEVNELDRGQRKRLLGTIMMPVQRVDRSHTPKPELYAPWDALDCSNDNDDPYCSEVGYMTGSGHYLSQLVHLCEYDREDIPLLTEWEQVSCCGPCKGSSGRCPGYSPRFDKIKPSMHKVYVLAVTYDMAWALEYGSRATWKYTLTWMDRLSMNYVRRLLNGLRGSGRRILGLGSCSGKCKPCAVLEGNRCTKPHSECSMEAAGIDCDAIHEELYGEWLPWAYKGMNLVPTYMTRYACVLTNDSSTDVAFDLALAVKFDKYHAVLDVTRECQDKEIHLVEIPSGVHAGCMQYMYSMED